MKQPSRKPIDRVFVKGGATTVILSILSERPMHGYELIQTIRMRTEGIFDFSDGTVYPLLYTLRDKGYLESTQESSPSGRARKIYRLTPAGHDKLADQLHDWKQFALGMKLALLDSAPTG